MLVTVSAGTARVVTFSYKAEFKTILSISVRPWHITPVLMQLHWLPVVDRGALWGASASLQGVAWAWPRVIWWTLSSFYRPSRALGSATDGYALQQPRTKTARGDRAFSRLGTVLWNGLPLYIRAASSLTSFKTRLKTFLFEHAFKA